MKTLGARALLREAGLRPKRAFGQNFLIEERVTAAIALACVPNEEEGRAWVVELGAGLGALTTHLVRRAARVTAVERDRDLIPLLVQALKDDALTGRLHVVEADAQAVDVAAAFAGAAGAPRVLCGNLPYQITGRLLELAVDSAAHVERVVYMMQQEVCDRLLARPGTKEYGALTVFTRAAFDAKRVMRVGPGAFLPSPGVTSAVVVLTPVRPRRTAETPALRAVVKAAFAQRRKTLRNAWRGLLPTAEGLARIAAAAGVSLEARGETLDVEAFARAARALETETSVR